MRQILAVLLLTLSVKSKAAYIETIFNDPKHPYLSASALYTPKFEFDGAQTSVAIAYHRADPKDSLWPQKWIDAGVPALSWQLLELGAGGDTHSGFVSAGASVDLGPTLLGPLAGLLGSAGGSYATAGKLLVSPDGSGLKLGYGAKSVLIQNGGLVDWKDIRIVGRYEVGYVYKFSL